MTLKQLKDSLNEKLSQEKDVPYINCRKARQQNTLILKSNTEDNTEQLLRLIENHPEIMSSVELTIMTTNQRRLLITGIPLSVTPENMVTRLKESSIPNDNIQIEKILRKEHSNIYHLVITLEAAIAQNLLAQKNICIGLNTCNIRPYRPIIRCANCQLYGHNFNNCIRHSICAKCSRGHQTQDCPHAGVPSQYRCTNCYNSRDYFKHTADSTKCPVYQAQLADRKTFTWSDAWPSLP